MIKTNANYSYTVSELLVIIIKITRIPRRSECGWDRIINTKI